VASFTDWNSFSLRSTWLSKLSLICNKSRPAFLTSDVVSSDKGQSVNHWIWFLCLDGSQLNSCVHHDPCSSEGTSSRSPSTLSRTVLNYGGAPTRQKIK
jgi:hypothetical protein